MSVSDKAVEYFSTGFNCAESTLLAVSREAVLGCDSVPRIATGFGGGMGRCGEVCGALSGAIMALGLKFGRDDGSDLDAKEAMYAKVSELIDAFTREFGTVHCGELLGQDLRTPEGREWLQSHKPHPEVCIKAVRFASAQAWAMIQE